MNKLAALAVVAAACGPRRDPTRAAPMSPLARLDVTFDRSCGDCHDAGVGPDVSAMLRGDHELLWRAAEQVASGEMPPNSKMTTDERLAIVRDLCDSLGNEAASCAHTMLLDQSTTLARTPEVLQRDIETTWNVSPATSKLLGGLASSHAGVHTYDDLDLNLVLSLSALEGCSVAADGVTARSANETERCVRALLDRAFVRPLPLPAEAK